MIERGITARRDGDTYIVSDNVTLMYGQGDTPEEARADYETSVRELIEILRKSGNALDAPYMIAVETFARGQGIDIG